jgi:hypothetical protein
MVKLSKIDWDIVDARVRSTQAERKLPNLSTALLVLVLDQFFPAAGDEILESITDGPGDRGVTVYAAKLLLTLRNATVPTGEAAEALANEAIGLVARACAQSKAVAHYQMFRSPRTKDKILAELSGKQGSLFDLLAAD